MRRDDYPTFLDWWAANEVEYRALIDAQDGEPARLADLVRSAPLATREAREFVADRLEGKKKQRGRKRTAEQQATEIGILMVIRDIQREQRCSEYRAMIVFLDLHPRECDNLDTLKTHIRRAKESLRQIFGREPSPPWEPSQDRDT